LASDLNRLGTAADQLHLHAAQIAVVTSFVKKLIDFVVPAIAQVRVRLDARLD
jgi:hypothetical protein